MDWFRFYNDTVNNAKAQKLSGDMFKIWVNLLCIASENEGVLPTLSDVAFALRCNENSVSSCIKELISADLFVTVKTRKGETYAPKNWKKRQYKSDSSTKRVKRFRERSKSVSVTPPEQSRLRDRTDTDSEQTQAPESRFSQRELSQFRKQASKLTDQQFQNEVSNCEIWLKAHGSNTPELTLSKWLQKANNDAKPQRDERTNAENLAIIQEAMGVSH